MALDGKLNMVTRTGVRVLGHCSNYSKDNWYYSLKLNNQLIVDLGMILNPRVVNTSHGKAISITPMVKLSAHIKDFNESNIDVDAHGQDFGLLWGILDFTNFMIKTLISNPTHLENELKQNFQVGEGISIASLFDSSGLVNYNQMIKLFDGLGKINEEVKSANQEWGTQIQELEDSINEKIQVALRKYRPWAADAGESNPNTVYIPYSSVLDNLPEPKPLKATVDYYGGGCAGGSFRATYNFKAIDATRFNVYRKSGSNWIKTHSGPTYSSASYAKYKVEGCNTSGCGLATEFVVPGRTCGGQDDI